MNQKFTQKQVRQMLNIACDQAGGQSKWAGNHGLSPQYVCDVLMERREPGKSILDALGLDKVVTYVRKT